MASFGHHLLLPGLILKNQKSKLSHSLVLPVSRVVCQIICFYQGLLRILFSLHTQTQKVATLVSWISDLILANRHWFST